MSRLRGVLVVLLVLACAACVRLPEDGPVNVASEPARSELDDGIRFDPRPPQRGESSRDIVRHFLDAMMANPIQVRTARQFLTEAAAEAWDPSRRTILYSGALVPVGQGPVTLDLPGAQWLDAGGRWQGALPRDRRRVELPMAFEDGEWRISEVPDAMIVHQAWFQERFVQRSLYFFDPSAEILVPEPVFVPRGSQHSTALVRGLLQGPPPGSGDATTSFFPPGAALADVSVPVSGDGVAEVSLRGEIGSADSQSLELMLAQLAWTLRQDPTVTAVRVTIGDTPVTLAGGVTDFPVSAGARYDPEGGAASTDLFGLRDGLLVTISDGETSAVTGPFGSRALGLRDLTVDLSGSTAVGVTRNGSRLLRAPVRDDGTGATTLASGATDLARPAWDVAGRLWIADRRATGTVVSVASGDRPPRRVAVPGISGQRVIDLTVSRDGTRLVAALDRPGGDVVVVSRLAWSARGVRATPARVVDSGDGRELSLRDLGWRSPTELVVLAALTPELSEVRSVTVDGAPAALRGVSPAELLRESGRRLVSLPVSGLPAWVVTDDGDALQLSPLVEGAPRTSGIAALTYVG